MKSKMVICIPSKGKHEEIAERIGKICPEWIDCVVGAEESEAKAYEETLANHNVHILHVENNCGVGGNRKALAKYALENGYEYSIPTDDNVQIADLEDFKKVEEVMDLCPGIAVLGATNRLGTLYNGWGELPKYSLVQSKCFWVLSCHRTSIYQYLMWDEKLPTSEDTDMSLRVMAEFGPEALKVLTGWNFEKQRHEKGGYTSYRGVDKNMAERTMSLPRLLEKHGKFFYWLEKKNTICTQWKKFIKNIDTTKIREVPR